MVKITIVKQRKNPKPFNVILSDYFYSKEDLNVEKTNS